MQDEAYRESVASLGDRWDGMAVTNRAWQTMRHWIGGPIARDYSLSSDFDDRWRTGGTVEEVIDEAHLGPDHILAAIQRFVTERQERLARVRELAEAAAAN
jgi:transketolase